MSRQAFDMDTAGGLKMAFSIVLLLEAVAYAWFALGWRRHASRRHGAVGVGV